MDQNTFLFDPERLALLTLKSQKLRLLADIVNLFQQMLLLYCDNDTLVSEHFCPHDMFGKLRMEDALLIASHVLVHCILKVDFTRLCSSPARLCKPGARDSFQALLEKCLQQLLLPC